MSMLQRCTEIRDKFQQLKNTNYPELIPDRKCSQNSETKTCDELEMIVGRLCLEFMDGLPLVLA